MLTVRYLPVHVLATPNGRDAMPALREAMARWEKSGLVKFDPYEGERLVCFSFASLGENVAAHTSLSSEDANYVPICFNQNASWSLATGWRNMFTFGAENMVAIACHEMGHALGLEHAPSDADSVMVHNDPSRIIFQSRYPTNYDFNNLKAVLTP